MRLLFGIFLFSAAAFGEMGAIRIQGRPMCTVANAHITLGDVADVYSEQKSDDDAVIALRSIKIATSPQPGAILDLSSDQILNALKAAQVDLQQVGYKLPLSLVVTRAGREISETELRASIEQAFSSQGREVIVHSVDVADPFVVEPGDVALEAALLPGSSRSRASFMVTARGESSQIQGKVIAAIEEWKQVAVAARSLPRGAVVGPQDVMMARLQSHLLPPDTSNKPTTVVGLALQSGISAGEAFSNQKLVVPAVITAGSRVTMLVRQSGLEATASGIALEPGAIDQRISVRNEASKRLVTGKVLEPGLVLIEEKGSR